MATLEQIIEKALTLSPAEKEKQKLDLPEQRERIMPSNLRGSGQ